MSDPLSSIGKATSRISANIIEKLVIQFMAPFGEVHLKKLIENDITIIELLKAKIKKFNELSPNHQKLLKSVLACFGMAHTIVSKLPKQIIEPYLSYKNIIKWVKQQKPELEPLLKTTEGKAWLEKEINELKEWVFNGGKIFGSSNG